MADILHRLNIDAPPETVFDAIATPEGIRAWWTDDSTSEPRAGSVSVFNFMDGEVVFRMRVDEYVAGRRLVWTCLGDYDEWDGTTLTWNCEPTEDGKTVLNLAHSGWASTEKEYPQCNTSWGNLFHVIRDYAEGKSTELPQSGRSS
jgi:uncharacterized protein YndB with AHSA1/START domain